MWINIYIYILEAAKWGSRKQSVSRQEGGGPGTLVTATSRVAPSLNNLSD